MTWTRSVPAAASGKYWGVSVQRHVAPADWPKALDRIPADRREAAADYLRDIHRRARAQRKARATT